MRRRGRASRRGATLIEVLVAAVILSVGTAGLLQVLQVIFVASRQTAFQTTSLDVYGMFAAQVRDARCDVSPGVTGFDPATTDPGLVPGGFVLTAIPGSAIVTVDKLPTTPAVSVSYQVTAGAVAGASSPPSLDIVVRIREITGDPQKDDPTVTSGYWIREMPLKKNCTLRVDPTARGEY